MYDLIINCIFFTISSKVTRFCEISPLWQIFQKSLWPFKRLLNIWQTFEPTLAHCYAIGQIFIVVNGQNETKSGYLVTLNSQGTMNRYNTKQSVLCGPCYKVLAVRLQQRRNTFKSFIVVAIALWHGPQGHRPRIGKLCWWLRCVNNALFATAAAAAACAHSE